MIANPPLRVVHSGALAPSLNMGLDEAMLTGASPPTLRLYGWSPAAVSLGRFQSPAALGPIAAHQVVVRRITGGGAIHHAEEITFALVLEARLLPDGIAASYDLVHGAIARALLAIGVPVSRAGGEPACAARPRQPWCFREPGCFDLVVPDGRKILGSAQRRIRHPQPRVLHHGSLPLRRPPLTPWCGAVADHVDVAGCADRLRTAIVGEIAAALRLTPVEDTPTDAELDRARELAIASYADLSMLTRAALTD